MSNIFQIIYSYIILSHIIACLFIVVAKLEDDFNFTWLTMIPSPQKNYINNYRYLN